MLHIIERDKNKLKKEQQQLQKSLALKRRKHTHSRSRVFVFGNTRAITPTTFAFQHKFTTQSRGPIVTIKVL